MPRSASKLESHLGYWLRFVSNHVSHAFQLKVESHGVTVAEWVVLRTLLDLESASPSEIAEKMGFTRGAVSKLVDRLIGKKLVHCQADKGDRRRQTLSLSESGRKLIPALAELADLNDQEFFGHLTRQERAGLLVLLQHIVEVRGLKTTPTE